MRLPLAFATALLLAAAAVPLPVSAQAHEHGAGGAVAIAHDVPADGTTFVGTINHFAVIVKGDDPVPDYHNNIHVRVVLNGVVLFETTPDSGHDYDGVNAFDVVFPAEGAYSVEALDPEDAGSMVAMFTGRVLPAPGPDAPQGEFVTTAVSAVPSEQIMAGQPVHFTVDLLDGPASSGGARIDHSDTWFEAWKDGRLEFRTKLHIHDGLQELDYAFQEAGTYTVRFTGYLAYPSEGSTHFAPVVHEQSVLVLPGPPVNAVHPESPPMPAQGEGLPPLNAVVEGTPGEYLLVGTFDPYTVVGPDTLQHLYALVVDPATGEPVQHVDFQAVFHGPVTHLFSSQTLHEYDGIYELTTRQLLPGAYTLDVTAERGGWSDTIHMTYVVAPPVVAVPTVASSVGPVEFSLQQGGPAPTAGATADFLLHGEDLAGEPFAHNEVEFRVFSAADDEARSVPMLSGKLHTHDDGDYAFRVAFPEAGTYRLELTPTPLMPHPVLLTAQSFDIVVGEGPGLPAADIAAAASGATQESPAAPGLALVAVLAALALALRRRDWA